MEGTFFYFICRPNKVSFTFPSKKKKRTTKSPFSFQSTLSLLNLRFGSENGLICRYLVNAAYRSHVSPEHTRLNCFLFLNVTVFKSMYRVKAEVLVDLKVCRWTHTFVTVCVLRLFLTASFAYFFIFFVQPGGADSLFQLSQGDSKLKTDPIPLLKPQQELTWCQKRVWGWRRPLLNQTLNITITTVEKSLYLLMLLHSILLKCQMKFKRLS